MQLAGSAAHNICLSHCHLQALTRYSDEQVRDLLLLRRLYYAKQGQLDRQRQKLMSRLACTSNLAADSLPNVGVSSYSAVMAVVQELQANAAEEHCVSMQCCCACFRGVSTPSLPLLHQYLWCHKVHSRVVLLMQCHYSQRMMVDMNCS